MYKFPEGSQEERRVFNEAITITEPDRSKPRTPKDTLKLLECEIVTPKVVLFGYPTRVKVKIHNITEETVAVKFVTTLAIQSYTGELSRNVTAEEHTIDLEARKEHTQSVEASFEQYGEEEDVLYATCFVSVTDKDYCTVRSGTSSIMHPKLYITAVKPKDKRPWSDDNVTKEPPEPEEDEPDNTSNLEPKEELDASGSRSSSEDQEDADGEITLMVTFMNPLPVKLTGGVFNFTDPKDSVEIKLDRAIEANNIYTHTFKWRKPGPDEPHLIVVGTFSSNEIKRIRGSYELEERIHVRTALYKSL